MDSAVLLHNNRHKRSRREQVFINDISLLCARAHEFCGSARRTLAMMLAARVEGPVFWISPAWTVEKLHAQGMQRFVDPGRFTFLTPTRPEDVLWVMEEVLRNGIIPLVVADIPAPPALTPVRRLHLAAETGASESGQAPLGVLVCGSSGGAAGIESRWQLTPAHGPDRPGWCLTRQRARTAPPKSWRVEPQKGGFQLSPEPITDASDQGRTAKPNQQAG